MLVTHEMNDNYADDASRALSLRPEKMVQGATVLPWGKCDQRTMIGMRIGVAGIVTHGTIHSKAVTGKQSDYCKGAVLLSWAREHTMGRRFLVKL